MIKKLWSIEERKWTNEYLINNPQQMYMTGYYGEKKTLHTSNIGFQMAKLSQENRREELKIYVEETEILKNKYKNRYGNNSEGYAKANRKIREERSKIYSDPAKYREARIAEVSASKKSRGTSRKSGGVALPNQILDVTTGTPLFRSGAGYTDAQTGTYHHAVAGGIINTQTGEFSPTF